MGLAGTAKSKCSLAYTVVEDKFIRYVPAVKYCVNSSDMICQLPDVASYVGWVGTTMTAKFLAGSKSAY